MENFWKFALTITIWVLSAGIGITALIVSETNSGAEDIAILSLLTSLVATFIIWAIPELTGSTKTNKQSIMESVGKAKRSHTGEDRVSMLLQLMTEDEREAFKHSLQQQILHDARLSTDGEFVSDNTSLESLLHEDSEQQRYNY